MGVNASIEGSNPSFSASGVSPRRGGRAVECGGLENRYRRFRRSRVQIPPPPLHLPDGTACAHGFAPRVQPLSQRSLVARSRHARRAFRPARTSLTTSPRSLQRNSPTRTWFADPSCWIGARCVTGAARPAASGWLPATRPADALFVLYERRTRRACRQQCRSTGSRSAAPPAAPPRWPPERRYPADARRGVRAV